MQGTPPRLSRNQSGGRGRSNEKRNAGGFIAKGIGDIRQRHNMAHDTNPASPPPTASHTNPNSKFTLFDPSPFLPRHPPMQTQQRAGDPKESGPRVPCIRRQGRTDTWPSRHRRQPRCSRHTRHRWRRCRCATSRRWEGCQRRFPGRRASRRRPSRPPAGRCWRRKVRSSPPA